MAKRRSILVTLINVSTFLVALTRAATPAPPGVRVFAMTYMITNSASADAGYSHVAVSSVDSAATRITIPSAGVSEYSLLRQNNGLTKEYVTDTVQLHNAINEGVSDRGVIVITNDTADVFGGRMIVGSGDSFHALPLTVNGRHFYIPSYNSMSTGRSFYGIAAASSTCLEVYSINDAGGYKLEDSVSLEYGDVFQKYSPDTSSTDYTGLYISSSGPIAVFSGHECAQIPTGTTYCDHMVDQIPAVRFWGLTTIVPPVPDRLEGAGYTVRIVASQDTMISFPYNKPLIQYQAGCDVCTPGVTAATCMSACQITEGRFLEVRVTNTLAPITVTCSVPCLVVQYGHSLRAVIGEMHDPDPFMAVITPTDHYVNKMSYVTPSFVNRDVNGLDSYANFITLISKTTEVDGLRLDGGAVNTAAGVTHGDYTVISQAVTHGTHTIHHADPTKKVMAFPVGHNPATLEVTSSSYRFSAGYEIDDMTLPGEWTDLISIPDGVVDPDVTTQAPRVCTRSASSEITSSFVLRGVAPEADVTSCYSAMNAVRLNAFAEQINEAICDRVICPNVPDDVYVKSLRPETTNGMLHLTIDLANSLDATVMSMVECRVHITNYMRQSDFWAQSVLPTDDLNTCYEVIVTLEKIQGSWMCPNPEASIF